jgi:hypothetical protein
VEGFALHIHPKMGFSEGLQAPPSLPAGII